MVMKELTSIQFLTLGGCGGLERTHFLTVFMLRGCGGLERTDF